METLRYILTRACLQEGSVQLHRSLRPHFPSEGTVKLFDEDGHDYRVRVSGGQLLDVGPFYRDHHLNVNDVVLITPLLPGCYKVQGVVKPYARPELERSRAAKAPEDAREPGVSQVRVVVSATPHVREVRTQRGEAPEVRASAWASMEQETAERAQRASRYRDFTPIITPEPEVPAQAPAERLRLDLPQSERPSLEHLLERPSERSPERAEVAGAAATSGPVRVRPVRSGETQAPELHLAGPAEEHRGQVQGKGMPDKRAAAALARLPAHLLPEELASEAAGTASVLSQRLMRDLASAPDGVRRESRAASERAAKVGGGSGSPNELLTSGGTDALPSGGRSPRERRDPASSPAQAELQLEQLSRRSGYGVDRPAPGLLRLQADLGRLSHTVLVGTGAGAAASALWRAGGSSPTFRVWLTTEERAAPNAPVVTAEALALLLDAGSDLRPLTPLDLGPLWQSGQFGRSAAERLLAQRRQEAQQDAAFASVLSALSALQAPALVSQAALAQAVPQGELSAVLEQLSRAPYHLLAPVGGEAGEASQYLLLQDAAAAALPRQASRTEVSSARTWTAEEILLGR